MPQLLAPKANKCFLLATARGDLGRHTGLADDGFPVFDHRLEVLLQVCPPVLL